jgi:DNA adenine methylase Dam
LLYTLILFGFNNQLRFNDKGEFNLPVGKRDFNTAIEAKLIKFLDALRMQRHEFQTKDFRKFNFANLTENSLVYCDPPYLITTATYNEKDGWTEQDERDLLVILDELTNRGIRFALSNVLQHEGKENSVLIEWIGHNNYRVHNLFMDYHYSNYQKKSKKAESQEVLITNY